MADVGAVDTGGEAIGDLYNLSHCMKHVHKTVLLWYSPREMYDLVTAIDDYPRFLFKLKGSF